MDTVEFFLKIKHDLTRKLVIRHRTAGSTMVLKKKQREENCSVLIMSADALLDRSPCSHCDGNSNKVVHFCRQPGTTTCCSTGEKHATLAGIKCHGTLLRESYTT